MSIFSQSTPPDLSELLQQLTKRLSGNKTQRRHNGDDDDDGGDGGGNNKNEIGWPMPPTPILVTLIGSLLVLSYLFVGFFTVEANERVVMFRLGNPFDVRGPGLKWHLPLIESYRKVNVSEVRRVEVGYRNDTKNKNLRESLMLTGNLNIIDMQFVVQYVLNDPELFLFENRFTGLRAEDVVQQVAETAMREIVGRNNIDFVLYEGRETVAEETKQLMQNILVRYKTGIEVRQVAVQNVQPPDQVQDAFEDAIKARQDRERKINEGEAYANNILPRVEGQAARIVKSAQAYKESMVVRSTGEADRFLLLANEYVQAPEVTRRRLYLETVESIMQRARKIVVDENISGGNLLYLPLDKILAAGATQEALRSSRGEEDDSSIPGSPETLNDLKDSLRQQIQSGVNRLEALR